MALPLTQSPFQTFSWGVRCALLPVLPAFPSNSYSYLSYYIPGSVLGPQGMRPVDSLTTVEGVRDVEEEHLTQAKVTTVLNQETLVK